MRKQILEQLTKEMVEILLIDLQEENATENSQTIRFKHYNKDLVAKAVAAAGPKYSLEWSFDIIRDEVYATIYESMDIVSQTLKLQDIRLDNKAFAGPVYNMTMLKLKDKLIPASKRNGKELIEGQEIAASQLGTTKDGQALTIEDILVHNEISSKDLDVLMGIKEVKMNQFLNWFNNNKDNILTRKQIEFLEGNVKHKDLDKARTMRRRISDRVSKAYGKQYGQVSPKIANLIDQRNRLETILNAKDFNKALNKHLEDDMIIDAITTNVPLKTIKAYNNGSTAPAVIKEYRVALFKKLGEVITIIKEANK